MNHRTRLASTAIAAGLLATLAVTGEAAADTAEFREYVALGDSWTADVFTTLPPLTDQVPLDCAQSRTDYPHRLAEALGIPVLRDASCGSARTAHMTAPQSLPLGGTNPPQFDRLTATTDLVTVSIGYNDIFNGVTTPDVFVACLRPVESLTGRGDSTASSCTAEYTAGGTDRLATALSGAERALSDVIDGIRTRAPRARVLFVNYLSQFPADGAACLPDLPMLDTDIAYLSATFAAMNTMMNRVAAATGVQLVDAYAASTGHDICQSPQDRYIEGVVPTSIHNDPGLSYPIHPNGAGAAAQTAMLLAALGR